jgi:adhesin transport system outer membrane protein
MKQSSLGFPEPLLNPTRLSSPPEPRFARRAGPAIAVALAVALAPVGPTWAETINDTVSKALSTSPKILGATGAARTVTHEIVGAQSQMNARYGVILEPGYGYTRGYGSDTSGNLGVQAVKPLYDSGRTENEVARQRARLAAANQTVARTRAAVALEVADAHLEVVKQQALTRLAKSYVDAIAELNGRVEEIVQIDRGRGYDLLQTQSRLSQARLSLASRDGSLQEARAALNQLVGQPVAAPEEPASPRELPRSLEEALAALDRHPGVLAAMAEVDAARRNAAVANAWDKPSVNARARVTSPEYPAGTRRWFGGYDVGLVTDWNPFDGGAGAARAAAAASQIATAEESLAVARRDLSNEVSRYWTQMQSRNARTGSLDTLVEGTRRVRAAFWEQFQIGKRSILDLLNAENETYQSSVSATTERLELLQVRYRLLGAQARLTEVLGIEAPPPVIEIAPDGQAQGGHAQPYTPQSTYDRLPDLRFRQ